MARGAPGEPLVLRVISPLTILENDKMSKTTQ